MRDYLAADIIITATQSNAQLAIHRAIELIGKKSTSCPSMYIPLPLSYYYCHLWHHCWRNIVHSLFNVDGQYVWLQVYELQIDACCWRKVLVPWVPSFAFAHNSVNELPRHQSKPRVSCRGDVFWRVAFNSIVAFHRGIIHLLLKSEKEYLLCQCQRATTLFPSKFYFVLHLIMNHYLCS